MISGDLSRLKKGLVIKLANPLRGFLNELARSGLTGAEEEVLPPWQDEKEDEFQERINSTSRR